jgi:ABC-type branched-subunit amino acid transport system substrate-binding protein
MEAKTGGLSDMHSINRRTRALVATVAALGLVVAACGSDESSDDTTAATEAPATTEAPAETEAPRETGAPAATGAPAETDAPAATETPAETDPPTTEPMELTATARGVTADTITVGYSYLDFDELVSKGFSSAGWGDQELEMQSIVDAVNANGGINGRMIEVIYKPYSALGTESAEAVCLELTQDNEVFAVLGGYLGPAEPANTCIAGRGETILVGGVQSEERLGETSAPWLAARVMRTRQAEVLLELLDSEGMLEGAEVAVVARIDSAEVLDDVVASMEAAGVPPVETLQSEAAVGDIVAEDNEWAILAERIRGSGADTVFLIGNPGAGIRNIAAQGLDVEIWALDEESMTALGNSVDLEDARGVITASTLDGQELWDHETAAECRKTFEAANPDVEIIGPNDQVDGDEDWTRGLTVACRFFELFARVATAAGAELTNETFAAVAASDFGQFSIVGQPFSSLGPDKFDSNDSFALVSFDPDIGAAGGFDKITEIRDVTP